MASSRSPLSAACMRRFAVFIRTPFIAASCCGSVFASLRADSSCPFSAASTRSWQTCDRTAGKSLFRGSVTRSSASVLGAGGPDVPSMVTYDSSPGLSGSFCRGRDAALVLPEAKGGSCLSLSESFFVPAKYLQTKSTASAGCSFSKALTASESFSSIRCFPRYSLALPFILAARSVLDFWTSSDRVDILTLNFMAGKSGWVLVAKTS
mmetsp:Transcript_23984/g.56450  ORF Transcript_23984/g.56450 Transcript_23984/m.56450 type:complete len:208 (-) Transcript_23984:270-893(-)